MARRATSILVTLPSSCVHLSHGSGHTSYRSTEYLLFLVTWMNPQEAYIGSTKEAHKNVPLGP